MRAIRFVPQRTDIYRPLPTAGTPTPKTTPACSSPRASSKTKTVTVHSTTPNAARACPFCRPDSSVVLAANAHALAIRDGFPISNGHALVVPRRHVASLSEIHQDEAASLWTLLAEIRSLLDAKYSPEGYNIGVNDGTAAGQTVMHLHIHLIPRYAGDVPDPRGGVRWVIPSKADYWTNPSFPSPA